MSAIMKTGSTVSLFMSAFDTRRWAQRPGKAWPCSSIAGHKLEVHFDRNGINEWKLDGKTDADIDANELTAICADTLEIGLDADHPCHFVAIGQFR